MELLLDCCPVPEQWIHARTSARSPAALFAARTTALRNDDFTDSAAIAALTGGDFSKTRAIRRSARWLNLAGSSRRRSANLPRSMAIATLWSKTVSGTSTLWGRDLIVAAPVGQTVLQTPHPRQISASQAANLVCFSPSVVSSILIASTGHALTHLPHPLHFERSISTIQFDVTMPG